MMDRSPICIKRAQRCRFSIQESIFRFDVPPPFTNGALPLVHKIVQPHVCTYNVMTMVKIRKPCLRAYTKIERVRKANCHYSDEWCVDYKPRTVYYTGYTHKLEPRYTTVHRCCEGCFPIDDRGCPHKECLQELTEICDEPRMSYCSCDDRFPEPAHCEPSGKRHSEGLSSSI
ncbi:multiple epidermal growth factor-like domains protein 6 [Caerostris extrusa]|uniref:Multiple epidermal growth factor-like domains protein 6 n=1 Tax=Caerostris extrusa TaxID=172846 RepID=A0AAV4QZR5_CAEEX|nr:multiple epidermal growth factor-like domains protein 6 [Caerostris extrusa]